MDGLKKTQKQIDKLKTLQESFDTLVNVYNDIKNIGATGLETELKQGKNNIVSAIKSKGVDASIDESMTSLADKITKIKEVEVKTLPAETSNVKANDLFNMIMKSQSWDSIYETVYENYVTNGGYAGVLMTALEIGTRTSIALTGADAYYILEEDKFYTTDENKNLVTFLNGVETKLGTKNHLWDVNNAQYWRHVFYLYVEGSTADGSREDVHLSVIDYCNNSNIPNIQYKSRSGNFMHFHVSNPDTCNLKWNGGDNANQRCYYFYTNVENANALWRLYGNNNALTFVNLDGLKKLTSGTLLEASRVKKIDFPNLTEVTDSILISQCNALESVDLSNAFKIKGLSTGNHNYILYNNNNIRTIILNDKVEISRLYYASVPTLCVKGGKQIISQTTTYPDFQAEEIIFEDLEKGRIWCGATGVSTNKYLKRIQLKSKGNRNDTLEILHTNDIRGIYILNDIEIAEGTRQTLTFTRHELDKENIINHIFKKLADNNFEDDGVTPAPAIKITIGSNNLDKLTDEEKAIATDKNYILA